MNDTLAGGICVVLSTMPGYPTWSDALMERFMTALEPVPDDVGAVIVAEVDRHFAERPTVKGLLEWAWTLSPRRAFSVEDFAPAPRRGLDPPGAPRLPGPDGRNPAYCGPPPHVRELMARLRAKSEGRGPAPAPDVSGEWGLVYEYPQGQGGERQRMPAQWSEAEARRRARAWNAAHAHCRAVVYRREAAGNISREMSAALSEVTA